MLFQEKRHLHLILEQLASNLCRKLECKNELNVPTTRLGSQLESVQDFFDQVGHLLEISTFSLNIVIVRLTKIMNRVDKN